MRTLTSLLGHEVETESGRRIGRCHDLRGEIRGSRLVVTGLVVGIRGVAEHFGLGGRGSKPTHVPWDAVVKIDGERFVVRDGTELE